MDPRWLRGVHGVLGVAGATAAVAMLARTDLHAVALLGPRAVIVVGLEGVRVLAETLASRFLLGRTARIPWWPLIRAHAVGYALAMTLPAGRTVAEATKAFILAPWVGPGRSAGVGATNQALVMLATGLCAVPCAVAALGAGPRALAAAVALQAVFLVTVGGGLLAAVRADRVARWVQHRWPRWAPAVAPEDRPASMDVLRALACFAVHRGVQAVEVGLVLGAMGHGGFARTLALTGACIVGISMGVAVPGQLGALGAALAVAGPRVGVPVPQALAVALVLHVAQFTWVAVGSGVWAVTRPQRPG